MQENTFGNILPISPQIQSLPETAKKPDRTEQMLEDAQRQLGELEGKLRERDQMKQKQELKIDELMHDLD